MSTITGKRAVVSRLALLSLAPALLLAVSACSAGPDERGPSGGKPSAAPGSLAEWQLSMSRCMREHGVDVGDPSADGMGATIDSRGLSEDQLSAASEACSKKLGTPPAMTEAEKKAADEAAQKMMITIAKCYRASGVDVPDPKPGQGLDIPKDAPADVADKCGGSADMSTTSVRP
ncbi:hypothetical protein [Leifsonia sp. WHRI 6310E]|uniref:hypothetical protein n=1 Tax=Leifsonia sp. WHRI 6310E TaxID=3162562 RepID=UPI0032EAEB7E